MCQINGKLEVYIDDSRGYMKGRAGKSWYIPPSGSNKLRQWVRDNKGKVICADTVRGMLTKIISVRSA